MKIRKAAAIYSIFMGTSMIVIWIMFYTTGEIPEIYSKPIEIGMHVAAEIVTAIALIVGGLGILINREWGFQIYLISMGMLMYTLIMSPGYFIQQGELAFAGMFAIFIIFAVSFIVLSFLKKDDFKTKT